MVAGTHPVVKPLKTMPPPPSMVIRVTIDREILTGVPWIANHEAVTRRSQTLDPKNPDVKVVDFVHRHPTTFRAFDEYISMSHFACHKRDVLLVEG